jgi:hypothetical protein
MKPPRESELPEWGDEPDPPAETAEQRLADLLEACLRAESAVPGSSAEIIQTGPEQLRRDLEQLVGLGQALRHRSSSISLPAPASRQALRTRIISRIVQSSWLRVGTGSLSRRVPRLLRVLWRGIVGRF